MDEKALITSAFEARERAYAPYSHFKVGAALLCRSGAVYLGCNIENAAYGPSNCAERTAIFKAVSEGESEFTAIAIVGGPEGKGKGEVGMCAPCGVCRQVMMEFCEPEDFRILLAVSEEEYQEYTLKELLPLGFGKASLE